MKSTLARSAAVPRALCFAVPFLAGSLLASDVAAAGATTLRAYPLPAGGSLELSAPLRWKEEITWTPGESWPRLRFSTEGGDDLAISLAAVPEGDIPKDESHPSRVRNVVDKSARAALGIGADKDLFLDEFAGPQGPGYFYSVVDQSVPEPPPPGVFRVLTQGAIELSDVLLTATILTQKQSSPELAAAIDMLRSARISDKPGDDWRRPSQAHLDRGSVGQRYEIALPPGFKMESGSPFQARDGESDGLMLIRVDVGASNIPDELRAMEAEMNKRSPENWLQRHRGRTLVAGSPAAELIVSDEHRDQVSHFVAVPRKGWVLWIEWRIRPQQAKAGTARFREALAAIRFLE